MKRTPATYLIARNALDGTGRIEYWSDSGWTLDKGTARVYRTLQAADRTAAPHADGPLYITE